MGKLFTPEFIGSGFNTSNSLNTNFENLELALDKVLSRSGEQPNAMLADLDLNSFNIINAGSIFADEIVIDGQSLQDLFTDFIDQVQQIIDGFNSSVDAILANAEDLFDSHVQDKSNEFDVHVADKTSDFDQHVVDQTNAFNQDVAQAVTDAIDEIESTVNPIVLQAEQARDDAQGYATAASSSATAASNSAGDAAGYVTQAQAAQTAAETAQGLAETAQSAAQTAASNAQLSATGAGNSAIAAEDAQAAAETAQDAAEQARDDALDAVASINLPVVGSGDAGKQLRVNSEEDGYELFLPAPAPESPLTFNVTLEDGLVEVQVPVTATYDPVAGNQTQVSITLPPEVPMPENFLNVSVKLQSTVLNGGDPGIYKITGGNVGNRRLSFYKTGQDNGNFATTLHYVVANQDFLCTKIATGNVAIAPRVGTSLETVVGSAATSSAFLRTAVKEQLFSSFLAPDNASSGGNARTVTFLSADGTETDPVGAVNLIATD